MKIWNTVNNEFTNEEELVIVSFVTGTSVNHMRCYVNISTNDVALLQLSQFTLAAAIVSLLHPVIHHHNHLHYHHN